MRRAENKVQLCFFLETLTTPSNKHAFLAGAVWENALNFIISEVFPIPSCVVPLLVLCAKRTGFRNVLYVEVPGRFCLLPLMPVLGLFRSDLDIAGGDAIFDCLICALPDSFLS